MEQEKKKSNKKKTVTDNLCGLSELQFREIYKSVILYSHTGSKTSGITQAVFSLLLKHGNDWVFTDNDTSIYKMMWGASGKDKVFRNSNDITKYLIPKKIAGELKENDDDIILIDLNYDSDAKAELLDNILTSREEELNTIFNVNVDDISRFNILNPEAINVIEVYEGNFFETFYNIKPGINSFRKGNKPLVVLNQTSGVLALGNFENYLKENKILSKKDIEIIKEEAKSDSFEPEEINAYELSGESDEALVILIGKSRFNDEVQKLYNDSLKFNLLTIADVSGLNENLICSSVSKCGKVLIVFEHKELSIISDRIARIIIENCFENLDAPVKCICSSDASEIKNKISDLLSY